MVGKIINGKYQVAEKLGAGGSGEVYKACHIHLGSPWALKFIQTPENYETNELEILKNLNHPVFPRLVDVIQEAGETILVFDYYDGPNMQKLIEQYGKIEEESILNWAVQILDALSYLHNNFAEPIIYRDLKPSNIIVLQDNTIKLIDFGTARLYKHEHLDDTVYLGTPGYAAPEQYGCGQTDVRTDIYNFGMTLFHLASGRHPLQCNEARYDRFLVEAGISEKLGSIILKCIAKDPDERFFNTEQVKEAFGNAAHQPLLAACPKVIGKNAVEISVSGVQSGVGVTHFCMLFGMWLRNRGYRTAVIECGENRDALALCKLVEKGNQVSKNGFFRIQGLSVYPSMGKEKIDNFKRYDYDYILIDYGIHDEYISAMMQRSDIKLVMAPGADWKMGQVDSFLKKYPHTLTDRNTFISFPLQNQKSVSIIRKYFRLTNMITVPYAINPWKPDTGVKIEIEAIYKKLFHVETGSGFVTKRRRK